MYLHLRFMACWCFAAIVAFVLTIGVPGCSSKEEPEETKLLQQILDDLHGYVEASDRSYTLTQNGDKGPSGEMARMLERAQAAQRSGDLDTAYVYLAAVLTRSPSNHQALDLLRESASGGIEGAEETGAENALEDATTRVAVLNQAIRSALPAASTVDEIESLLEREKHATALRDRLLLIRPSPAEASPLASRIAELALEAEEPGAGETDTRVLLLRAERLRDEAVDRVIDEPGGQADRNLSEAETLLASLNSGLEAFQVHALRAGADRQTERVLTEVVAILDEVFTERSRIRGGTSDQGLWQPLGEKLVEAEILVKGVSALSSEPLRRRAQEVISRLQKESVAVGAEQQSAYNAWAILQIKQAVLAYGEGKGWFNDSEAVFFATLQTQLGPIEPQYLHPAVSTLFGETYHKLISELPLEDKVKATEKIEKSHKRSLDSF